MKTRVYDFGHVFISLVFCMSMAACNKEDYYQKEFLDNPYQEEPTNDGSVNGGSQAGENSGAEGGAHGGVDSGVGGTTSGSTTNGSTSAGATSGGSDGSTSGGTDGSVAGGISGGTIGGSTSGGTDGSVAGGVSGGTIGGSTGGSTSGGTDGSVAGGVSGGTIGGSTGGSTSGGTDGSVAGGVSGGTTGGAQPVAVEEVFHQSNAQTKKIDIMWVIDNSGSMSDEQHNLGVNFNAFIQDFITKDVDFKMAITTTDTTSGKKGLMVSGSEEKLNSTAARNDPNQFMTDFKNMVKVGINGSGNEKGLEATEGFMERYSSSFIRPEAYLAVVVVSDEEDGSSKTPTQYTNYLKSFKSEGGLVKVYSIVDKTLKNNGRGVSTGFQRYAQASSNTAGIVSDIYDDFYTSLSDMGQSIINLLDSFPLANAPIDGSLKVYVNGQLANDYTYDAASHSIKFNSGSVPAVGAEVKVQYLK